MKPPALFTHTSSKSNVEYTREQLRSWVPIDALIVDGKPAIEWMEVSDVEFTEPFFTETLARVYATGRGQRMIADFDSLLQFEKSADSVSPSGFIFHSSRCGSTLLANTCKALKKSIVISEAPVVDKIISRFFTDAEQESAKEMLYMAFLRAAVSGLGQRRRGDEQHYFVKFACTSTLQMRRVRRVWPKVPFVFLYRDPVEIMVSNLKNLPEWMRPESNVETASRIVGASIAELNNISAEEFCARVLGRFFTEAQANLNSNLLCLNYDQLNAQTAVDAIRFFGIEPSDDELDAIQIASRLYSKDSTGRQVFQSDIESKRALATDSVIELAKKWAQPAYLRLIANS
jgi:hypothetical protein